MNNRLHNTKLDNLFRAPAGFELKEVIALTYSLDSGFLFDAFLPFVAGEKGGDWLKHESHYLKIFINSGSLNSKIPIDLLGNVCLVNAGDNTSFHPKIYFLSYVKNKERYTKLIIGSFNLTSGSFNRNKEFYVLIEGKNNKKKDSAVIRSQKSSLISFMATALKDVSALAKKENEEIIDRIKSGVEYVDWPSGVEFYYSRPGKIKKLDSRGDKCILVSPFWDSNAINELSKDANETELYYKNIPAPGEAPFEPSQILKKEIVSCYQSREEGDRKELHGKLYYFGNNDHGRVYIGSANCTSRAVSSGRNYEAGLMFPCQYSGLSQWLKENFCSVPFPKNYFQKDEAVDERKQEKYDNVFNKLEAGYRLSPAGISIVIKTATPAIFEKYKITCLEEIINKSPFYLAGTYNKNLPASVEIYIKGARSAYHLPISGILSDDKSRIEPRTHDEWYDFKKSYVSLNCSSPDDILDLYLGGMSISEYLEYSGELMQNNAWRERKFPFRKLMKLLYGDNDNHGHDQEKISKRGLAFLEATTALDKFGENRRKIFFYDFNKDREEYACAFYKYWKKYIEAQLGKSTGEETRKRIKKIIVNIKELSR